ncbi:hypothetical protein [Arcobacter sp. FWKO B]|uniref:hypothetical protein n=1 Tax=Arcobacter sp. FWKO B TaxID=2593672 RepID=UPI0018A60F36|nr:hypothetical protein [Arcobacter sp. FWKO B]QOG11353.1 hypothetical protein FWKOB_00985 [Arcobacter sp. FWKO B]
MKTNILKIAFLTILGLGLITYITAPSPKKIEVAQGELNLAVLPKELMIVGSQKPVDINSIIKKNIKNLLIVVNHDSIAVMKDLKKYAQDIDFNPILVANISAAPWFIKKWVIPSKMEELNKDSQMVMIYDEDGMMQHILNVTNNDKTHFVAFIINLDGTISKVYEGDVKADALEGSMNEEEIEEFIIDFISNI